VPGSGNGRCAEEEEPGESVELDGTDEDEGKTPCRGECALVTEATGDAYVDGSRKGGEMYEGVEREVVGAPSGRKEDIADADGERERRGWAEGCLHDRGLIAGPRRCSHAK
jgi:hypothetical protein